jgi:hypothetical protein
LLSVLAACESPPKAGGVPEFSLKLRSASPTRHRYTYFELSRDGQLRYGGGRDAAQRITEPVTTLTAEQRREVWEIITDHHLMDAPSSPFEKPQEVAYEVEIKQGMIGKSFRALDDEMPGVTELHDYLFRIQAEKRYNVPGLKG